jgi:hypothetical protein
MKHKIPIFRIALIVWLVFTTFYFLYGEYNHFRNFVYKKGWHDSTDKVVEGVSACQPYTIEWQGRDIHLINADCQRNDSHSHDGEVHTHE